MTFLTAPETTIPPAPRRPAALTALTWWAPRHVAVAVVASLAVAVLIGLTSVLIPNSMFARDIPPVWWNYPVWLLTSALSGMLVATYVRADASDQDDLPDDRRSSRLGLAGGMLAWFAVGCPVCNKLVLLMLGTSGAMGLWAPAQPYVAALSLVLLFASVVWKWRSKMDGCDDGSCTVSGARTSAGSPAPATPQPAA